MQSNAWSQCMNTGVSTTQEAAEYVPSFFELGRMVQVPHQVGKKWCQNGQA